MKDFSDWHRLKSEIHEKDVSKVYFHEREIWYISCGVNVGFEQDGKNTDFGRPALILKKFNQHVFWGLPLTSREKTGKYYFPFSYSPEITSFAILSQLRLFDAKRLINHVGRISESDFKNLKQKIKELL